MSRPFNWKKYCLENNLSATTTKNDAINHRIDSLFDLINCQNQNQNQNKKIEPFSLAMNYNKNIAIFCHTIPTPDKDSGSNRLYEIIKILIDLGYNIYYLTHDCIPNEPKYAEALIDCGIKKILCIDKNNNIYCDELYRNLVEVEKINFEIAIFYFYEIYVSYWNKIKNITPTIKTIVDSVDLHWLRLERGGIQSEIKKESEKKVYNECDVVISVTENDKNLIQKECPQANVKIISNIHRSIDIDPEYKKNIIFVGGSNHTPNIEAAIKAINIFNKFINTYIEYSHCKLYLIGSTFNKSIIEKSRNNKNIKLLTNIDKASLTQIYKNEVSAALCPITWGAGIKGKICEAIFHNIPVITTEIGNEGINLINKQSGFIFYDENDALSYIKTIFSMTKEQLLNMTNSAKNIINLLVSPESAKDVLSGTLMSKHVVLSIATYNNCVMMERCVNSIIQNTLYPNYTIHITSNGSEDNTNETLKKLQDIYGNKIQFTVNKNNKHFILAHNNVIKKYPKSDIVLINDDMEFIDSSWLNYLYSSAYSAGYVGCAGGKTLDYNYLISESGAYLFKDGSGINIGRGKNRYDKFMNTKRYVGYVSGCLMYMKRSLIDQFGMLDDRFYPCYYEDSDWQYNIHTHGYKTIVDPRCEVLHKESTTGNRISNSFKIEYLNKNRSVFLEKYKNIDIEKYNL